MANQSRTPQGPDPETGLIPDPPAELGVDAKDVPKHEGQNRETRGAPVSVESHPTEEDK